MAHHLINASNGGPNKTSRLRIILISVATALLIAGLVIVGLRMYANSLPEANAKPTATGAAGASIPAGAAAGTWNVATGSSAQYRVGEVLAGKQVAVTGATQAVTGNVTIAGDQLTAATITVDLTNVTTDDTSRDEQFRKIVIDATKNPTATFTLKTATALPALTGTATKIDITGDITLNGTTKAVTASAEVAAKTDTNVSAAVNIPVTWSDFGVTPPDLGFVKVEAAGSIEVSLNLSK